MAKLKQLKSKPIGLTPECSYKSQTESIPVANKSTKASSQSSKQELKSEFANRIYESYDEPPSHKNLRRATIQPPEKRLSKEAVSSTPYDMAHTPQTAAILRSTSHLFENIFQSSYLSPGSNAPRKPASRLNYFPDIPLSSSKSTLSVPSATSRLFKTQNSSQTLQSLSSPSAQPSSLRNKSVDTLDKKRKSNSDDEIWEKRQKRLVAALLKDASPKPRTKPLVQVLETRPKSEETSTPCPAQRKVFFSGLNPSCFKNASTNSVESKASDPVQSATIDDSSDDDCMIISESEALKNISISQSKSGSPIDKSLFKKEEEHGSYKPLDLTRIHYSGPIEMTGARRSTSIISGGADTPDQPTSRKKAFYNTSSNLTKNGYVLDVARQVNVSSAGGSIASSNCDGFWDQDTDIDSLTKFKLYSEDSKQSDSDTDTPETSDTSDSHSSESSESEYEKPDECEESDGSNFSEYLGRKRKLNARARILEESDDGVSIPLTRRMSRRISKMAPIQCEILLKEPGPKKPSKKSAEKAKGTVKGNAARTNNENEEEVLPEHILSLLRPLAHPEPSGSITCNFVVPTYFKTTKAFIPKYKSFRKYITKHPSARSKQIDPWKMYRDSLKHFLECEEHRNQLPAIAFTAYVIDRNMGVNWGASIERKWDNAIKKGEMDNKRKKKRREAEGEDIKNLHKNVKKINKGVKSLHRKVDSSSLTLSRVETTLDEATYEASGNLI